MSYTQPSRSIVRRKLNMFSAEFVARVVARQLLGQSSTGMRCNINGIPATVLELHEDEVTVVLEPLRFKVTT